MLDLIWQSTSDVAETWERCMDRLSNVDENEAAAFSSRAKSWAVVALFASWFFQLGPPVLFCLTWATLALHVVEVMSKKCIQCKQSHAAGREEMVARLGSLARLIANRPQEPSEGISLEEFRRRNDETEVLLAEIARVLEPSEGPA